MSEMQHTRYGFEYCVGAFFEMPTSEARKVLPGGFQPLEKQHERSVFAVTAFRFTESEVGPYDEFVLAVLVPPIVEPERPLPKAAMFPFMVATTTEASRLHAIERWHLPHIPKELDISFEQRNGAMEVRVRDNDDPVLELVVTEHEPAPVRNMYCVFTNDAAATYKVAVHMEAPHSEHEEETGRITLHEHPFFAGIDLSEIDTLPFREEWYRAGVQTFDELEPI